MEVKPGNKTSEYKFTMIANLALAVIGALAIFGLVASEEAKAVSGVVLAVVPIAAAYLNGQYSKSRASVKAAASEATIWASDPEWQPDRREPDRNEPGLEPDLSIPSAQEPE